MTYCCGLLLLTQTCFYRLFLEDKDVKEEDKVLLVNILMKHDVADLIGRIILLPTLDRLKGANRRYFSNYGSLTQ